MKNFTSLSSKGRRLNQHLYCESKQKRGSKVRAAVCLLSVVGNFASAHAAVLQDKRSIWTIQVENDAVSTLEGTSDQYYTSGLRLGWTSGTDILPVPLTHFSSFFLGEGVKRVSLSLQQLIYTPRVTQVAQPLFGDRPYASLLLGTLNFINDTERTRSVVGLQAGVMGPAGLGRQVQNGFHDIIGDTANRGWRTQLQNQPVFQVQAGRIWRLPLVTLHRIEMDILPQLSGAAGDYRIYANAATTLRMGQGLGSDFGNATIGPELDGTDAYAATREVGWYVYGGVGGEAVGYDATLQGNTFRDHAPHVSKTWDVGSMRAGVALMWRGVRIAYSQNWETARFDTAKSGLFNYGSLKVSAKF